MYSIKIKMADMEVVTLTNVGAFTQELSEDGQTIRLGTADANVFAMWTEQLKVAGRAPAGD